MKRLLLPVALLLAACNHQAGSSAGNDYIVDLDRTQICWGGGECLNLELIVPSFNEIRIEEAYGLPTTNADWGVEDLASLLISPPNNLYQSEQIGPQRYQIPFNDATYAVWRYLRQEQWELYDSNDRGGSSWPGNSDP